MSISSLKYLTKTNYLNLLFITIPISFIVGNGAINTNIVLLILSSFVFYGRDPLKVKYYLLDKVIILFFLLIIFTGFFNNLYLYYSDIKTFPKDFGIIIKSLFYLRFLAMYLVVRFLIEKEILNFKYFFISCFLCSIFVSFDIFYQLTFGKDIFGFEVTGRKLSGPFGDELIAGSYLQRFSLFSFFLFPIFFNIETKKIIKFLIPLLFLIFISAIVISGNRMPVILFILGVSALLLFQKETRKYIPVFIVVFSLSFFLIFKLNSTVRLNFINFYLQIDGIIKTSILKQEGESKFSAYSKEFDTFYDTWSMNKYIGGGVKSFRYYCHERPNIDKNSKFICNMHPHNYYLEILTETGIFGFLIICTIFFMILYISFFKKYFTDSKLRYNHIITPFIFLFLIEIFPIKSTGSFFTTANATFIFLMISAIIALSRKENLN